MHGYGIALYLKLISKDVPQVEEGSLFPALQRLAIKGWVKAAWGTSKNNRRARFYKLTQVGRKQLKQEMADFERLLEALLRVMQPA
jgi:PadR family transcriptional regulator, regulatory protein PadR